MSDKKELIKFAGAGIVSGFLNGLFGSGGGVAAVLFLRKLCGDERRAHATATLMMLVMSAVSLALYIFWGSVDFSSGLRFLPGGALGALAGAAWLKSIDVKGLHRLFGAVMAASGAAMLLL